MIKNCTCEHKEQDEMYGKGRRVKNLAKGKNGEKIYRCTVCLAEKAYHTEGE